jgi:hypothetical protein
MPAPCVHHSQDTESTCEWKNEPLKKEILPFVTVQINPEDMVQRE